MNLSQPLEILIDSKDRSLEYYGVQGLGHVTTLTQSSRFVVEYDPALVFQEGSYLKLEKLYMPMILFNVPEGSGVLKVGMTDGAVDTGPQVAVNVPGGNYSVKQLVDTLNRLFFAQASYDPRNAVSWVYDPITFTVKVSKLTNGSTANIRVYFGSNKFLANLLGFRGEDTGFQPILVTYANNYHRSGFIHINFPEIVGGGTQLPLGTRILNTNWDPYQDMNHTVYRPKFVGFTIPNHVTPGEVLIYSNESLTSNIIGPILKPKFSRLLVEVTDRDGNLLTLNGDWYCVVSVLEKDIPTGVLRKRLPTK